MSHLLGPGVQANQPRERETDPSVAGSASESLHHIDTRKSRSRYTKRARRGRPRGPLKHSHANFKPLRPPAPHNTTRQSHASAYRAPLAVRRKRQCGTDGVGDDGGELDVSTAPSGLRGQYIEGKSCRWVVEPRPSSGAASSRLIRWANEFNAPSTRQQQASFSESTTARWSLCTDLSASCHTNTRTARRLCSRRDAANKHGLASFKSRRTARAAPCTRFLIAIPEENRSSQRIATANTTKHNHTVATSST